MEWNQLAPGCVVEGVATLACIPGVLKLFIQSALTLSGVVALFFLIWGGIKLINSAGEPEKVKGARNTLTYAIIGLVVVLSSFMIVAFVAKVTGADCINYLGFEQCK